ncbi:MAG: type II toxin-antitoxin system RelB/DinJ family antitoxin [Lachnospiraceae bacterium]|nr:type II toxin-antitoxin system RelB/DinJ family antitoxin [Lachnospiraceae bacterium]
MAKTSNIYVRIEPGLKDEAEEILAALGLSPSNAVVMFYKQIMLHKGLPFAVKMPSETTESDQIAVGEQSFDDSIKEKEGGTTMKHFMILDDNVPMQFFTECTGCVLDKGSKDRVLVHTADGQVCPVGIELPHFFSVQLYRKVLEASAKGGFLFIPDLAEKKKDEDALRKELMDLKVLTCEEGLALIDQYMEEIGKL